MNRNFFFITLLVFSLLVSCTQEFYYADKNITSAETKFQVNYDKSFESTVYPSLILGLVNSKADENESFEFFNYTVTAPENDCSIRIEISSSTINYKTVDQSYFEKKGTTKTFSPLIRWNYENLKTLNQPGTVDLIFTCFVNNIEIDNINIRLNYRSVNECVFTMIDADKKVINLNWMFASYVNEDHPMIDPFLQETLETGIIDNYVGYMRNKPEHVNYQVFSLWYALQCKKVKYSSITETSNNSNTIYTQYIRFFDEVYNNTQANCVDGTVFLASILKKIGLKPFLVLTPGHMYLGYYTDKMKNKYKLLETTFVGSIDLTKITSNNISEYGKYYTEKQYTDYLAGKNSIDDMKIIISKSNFETASSYHDVDFKLNKSKFEDDKNFRYQILDIERLRAVVQPINR